MELKGTAINQVLILDVDEEELIKRLILRGKTSGRSDDADENIQRNRQAVYKRETLPVADYYTKEGKIVIHVNGMGSISEIFERLSSQIDKKMK